DLIAHRGLAGRRALRELPPPGAARDRWPRRAGVVLPPAARLAPARTRAPRGGVRRPVAVLDRGRPDGARRAPGGAARVRAGLRGARRPAARGPGAAARIPRDPLRTRDPRRAGAAPAGQRRERPRDREMAAPERTG